MEQNCPETSCGIRKLCDDLRGIGCGGEPTWLGILLFVRNLIRDFSLFSDNQKTAVQQYVFLEFAKRDPSCGHMQAVLGELERFLSDNTVTASLKDALSLEQSANRAVMQGIHAFVRESLRSEKERSELLDRFGRDTLEALDSGQDAAVLVPRLRDLVTDMLAHYRQQAQFWQDKALQLEKLVHTDPLLAPLHNRRALNDFLDQSVALAETRGTPLSVLMIDVDNFKTSINDVYGHAVGDDVLRALAKIIDAHASQRHWFAARYGGDELVLVAELDPAAAEIHADAIRLAVQHYEFRPRIDGHLAEEPIRFTVSIGVSTYLPGMTAEALLHAADAAMYSVKGCGRNNVACYAPPDTD